MNSVTQTEIISFQPKINLIISGIKRSTVHSYCTRAAEAGNFDLPKVKTKKTKQSFLQSGTSIWNELPDHVSRSQSIESFQENMEKIFFNHN